MTPVADHQSDSGLQAPTVLPTVPTLPIPLGANDEGAQREWEHFQVQRGIARYRQSLTRTTKQGHVVEKTLDATTPGQRIASEIIRPMVDAVRGAQQAHFTSLKSASLKKLPDDLMVFTTLDAETLAACTVLTALTNPVDASLTSVAFNVAARVRHELEFTLWKQAEALAERKRKENGEDGINLFKLMLKRNDGDIDQRAFEKWSRKAATFTKVEWDMKTRVRIGMALLSLLVECDGWFQVTTEFDPQKGKVKKVFGMTDIALAAVSDVNGQCELQRPWMLPMICEPRDYEYIETAEPATAD